MWLKTIFKDDIGDSKGKIHSLTFDKLNEDNSEKKNTFIINNEENNNKTTEGQKVEGNNVLIIERIELSIKEDNVAFIQKKRNRNEQD